MPPKRKIPDSPSSTSASESASSDEEQETAVTQATPPSGKPAPNAKPPVSDDEDSGSDEDSEDEEEEEDEEGSDDSDSPSKPGKPAGKVEVASAVKAPLEDSESESGSESESSESTPKPPSPRRLSREPDSSAKPISPIPKNSKMTGKKPSPEKPKMPVPSMVCLEKTKLQVLENGEQGEAAAKKRKRGGQPSRSTGRFAGPNKRLVVGGEDVESEAEVLYPSLRDAIPLLETEGGNILAKGSISKAFALLNPAEANALEGRWKKHLAAGVRYFMERAALKEDLLKSLVGVLEDK